MKKCLLILLPALVCFISCGEAKDGEAKVMARYVPERYDDFIFENNFIAGRFYGEALEGDVPGGNVTSPGVDIWVKTPGALVCNQRYIDDLQNNKSYHKDWGNGKDCYKVSKSLGGGASCIMVDGELVFPATNYRSWEVLENTPDKVVFVLHYPQWEYKGGKISQDKKVTVTPDTYFVRVDDVYTFEGFSEKLDIIAGINRHPSLNTIEKEFSATDRYAIWEKASDTSVEPEDGMLGVGVYVPEAEFTGITEDKVTGYAGKSVASGEVFTYYFGSCWSKGELTTSDAWFNVVKSL